MLQTTKTQTENALLIVERLITMTRNITWDVMRNKVDYDKSQLELTNEFISDITDSIHNLPSLVLDNAETFFMSLQLKQEYKIIESLLEKVEKISHMECYKSTKSNLEDLIENNLKF